MWRDQAWDIMRKTPHLTYQILTKRPERIRECLPDDWPLPNVWLGVTVESQREDHRINTLCEIPAAIRFLSVEPMIGPVNLLPPWGKRIDWVICGGESGAEFREMDPEWARSLAADCKKLAISFFMTQMAGVRPAGIPIPEELMIREFPGEVA